MPRALFALLVASTVVLRSAPLFGDDPCPRVELRSPPTITPDEGVIWFTQEADADWWRCAKKAGGTLELEYLVREGGELVVKKTDKLSAAKVQAGAYRNFVCDSKAKSLAFRLVGTGPMESLGHTTEEHEVDPEMCPRCTYKSYETGVGIIFTKHVALNVGVGEEWFECAKDGSTWELRFYTGADKEEVMEAVKPAFIYDLKKKPKHLPQRDTIAFAKICKGKKPKWAAWEIVATGEMKSVSHPRVANEARWCK